MDATSTTQLSHIDWLNERKKGIGGSDAAAVLGVSKWKTPLDVYYDKIGEKEPEPINNRMHFGIKLEDVVAEEFMSRNNRKVVNDNKIRVHKKYPFILGNIDRIILANEEDGTGVLEIKTTSSFARKSWEGEVPYEWYCQVMHYLSITGYDYGYIAVLIDGNTYEQFRLNRDDSFIDLMETTISDFWNTHVENRIPPEITNIEDVNNYFNKVDENTSIEAADEVVDVLDELKSIKEEIKELEDKEKAITDSIKMLLANHETLTKDGRVLVTYKSSVKTLLDQKLIKSVLPDWEKYTTKSTSRTLLIKKDNTK